jgi:hypothetical protein
MSIKSHFESIMEKYNSLYLYLKLDKDFGWDWNETSIPQSGFAFAKYIEACRAEFINDLMLLDETERRIALEEIIKNFNNSKSNKLQGYFIEKLTPSQIINLIPRTKELFDNGKEFVATEKEWDLMISSSLASSYLKLIDEYLNWANFAISSPIKGSNKSKNLKNDSSYFKWDHSTTLCFFHLLRDSGLRPKGHLTNKEYCLILCEEFEIEYKEKIPKMFDIFHYKKLDKVKHFVLPSLSDDLRIRLEEYISKSQFTKSTF